MRRIQLFQATFKTWQFRGLFGGIRGLEGLGQGFVSGKKGSQKGPADHGGTCIGCSDTRFPPIQAACLNTELVF